MKTGARLGGRLIHAVGAGETPVKNERSAVASTPVRIAAGKRRMESTEIRRNPKIATKTLADVRCPGRTGAPGNPMVTIPVWFNPIKVRNNPMPTA